MFSDFRPSMTDEKAYPSQQQDRFIVRLPDGLRDRIKETAKANGRSMNAEIVSCLQAWFPAPTPHEYLSWLYKEYLDLQQGLADPLRHPYFRSHRAEAEQRMEQLRGQIDEALDGNYPDETTRAAVLQELSDFSAMPSPTTGPD